MAKEITGVIAAPMSEERAKLLIRLLMEATLKRNGMTADISVRERRPGETEALVQSVNGVRIRSEQEAV